MASPSAPSADAVTPLRGFTVGVTTEWRWQDQAEVLGRLGARVVHGSVVGPMPLVRREALEAVVDELVGNPPAVVVLPTGTSLENWSAVGEHLGCEEALRRIGDAARVLVGPGLGDAARASGLVVEAELLPTAAAVVRYVQEAPGPGTRIAVPLDDHAAAPTVATLRAAGLEVVEVPLCPRHLPEDPRDALHLVEALIERRLDAVTFTEAAQVRNLLAVAATAGVEGALLDTLAHDVVVACAGASCAAAALAAGMGEVVQPGPARTGAMLDALAARLGDGVLRLRLNGVDVETRGLLALVDGDEVWLTGRERGLLAALARRPGVVVPKAELLRRVWCSNGVDGADHHAVEVAVSRLRRRLGPAGPGLATVARRGYRLDPG